MPALKRHCLPDRDYSVPVPGFECGTCADLITGPPAAEQVGAVPFAPANGTAHFDSTSQYGDGTPEANPEVLVPSHSPRRPGPITKDRVIACRPLPRCRGSLQVRQALAGGAARQCAVASAPARGKARDGLMPQEPRRLAHRPANFDQAAANEFDSDHATD